ncbi:MAG: DUF4113 domain-containing protein [Bacteroidales bacterium]|nr:DUF4113 domain-containing protein [Bacteroidales bacterium]
MNQNAIQVASQGTKQTKWNLKHNYLSPSSSTKLCDIIEVKI